MAFLSAPEVRVVVLGRDDDEAVERGDLLGPALRVRLAYWPSDGGYRLVEVRQLVVEQVDQLELGVVALRGDLEDPAGDRLRRYGPGGCFRE